jgi:hypothetical protein
MEWLYKIVRKIAAEVHKSKIEDFEKRIAEMEKQHQVLLKSMKDNDIKLSIMDDRLYHANIESSKAVGAIQTVINTGLINKINNIGQNEK